MTVTFEQLPLKRPGPPLNAWGQFGNDDQLGRLNLITPEAVQRGLRAVKHGLAINLNLPMNVSPVFPNRIPFEHHIDHRGHCNDDVVKFNTQSTSQWDGFRHYPYKDWPKDGDYTYYGGQSNEEARDPTVLRNGIHNYADHPITSRAHLLDVASYLARHNLAPIKPLEEYKIPLDVVDGAAKEANIDFQPGDVLILHTGFAEAYLALSLDEQKAQATKSVKGWCGVESTEEMLRWHWEKGIAAVATDTVAYESYPLCPSPSLHQTFLAGWGLPIGELFDTRGLAKACREHDQYTFFFTSMPLNVPGGIASPPNAQAIL